MNLNDLRTMELEPEDLTLVNLAENLSPAAQSEFVGAFYNNWMAGNMSDGLRLCDPEINNFMALRNEAESAGFVVSVTGHRPKVTLKAR